MKTKTRSMPMLALASLLTFALCAERVPAQPALNLDLQPAFDFGDDPAVDPLFTPPSLGLTNGLAGFDHAAALNALAREVGTNFPPGMEVFIAYLGNPGYALLGGTALPAAPLGASSPLSLVSAFRPPAGRPPAGRPPAGTLAASKDPAKMTTIVPGRGYGGMAAEATQVSLGGVLYELPAPLSFISPLVLDLNKDGLLSASRGLWLPHPSKLTGPYAAFDMDGDGFKDVTEWLGPDDALLVTSTNPTTGRHLVGTAGGWRDGFEHLKWCADHDGDGAVAGPELDGLYVWRDANTNGIADAGEVVSVQSVGIAWIAATNTGNYTASFGSTNGTTGLLWDWWPNYALANRRSTVPGGGGGVPAFVPFPNNLVDEAESSRAKAASLPGQRHIPPAQLAAAGIGLASFRLALLADGGNTIIGYDASDLYCGEHRICYRLLRIRPGPNASDALDVVIVVLPFEDVFQLACDAAGRVALVLGNQGSRLAVVDFENRRLIPGIPQIPDFPGGQDLPSIGLRASGMAGYNGTFWFTAWQLDDQGEVLDERVWAITPWGFWGGLSLEVLRTEFGQLRSYFVTGPTSGFFAVPGPGGTNEQLWSIVGTNRTLVDTADSFGGMEAQARGKVKWFNDAIGYTKRDGAVSALGVWRTNGAPTILRASHDPAKMLFYPMLSAGGGTAIAATLDPATRTLSYLSSPTSGSSNLAPLLTTYPGQGKVAHGAFAHYGTNGMDLFPLPDPAPSSVPEQVWNYSLLPGSTLQDECLICDRLTIPVPMRGSFHLRLVQENPLFSTYAMEDLSFDAGSPPGATYQVRGKGTYQVGGEVGLFQEMFLEVYIDDGTTNKLCYFTNAVPTVDRLWPMLHLTLNQTNGTELQTFQLQLNAAPLRELWFSTASAMTSSHWQPPTNRVSPGDLVSSAGHVVKRNDELTRHLGIMPIVPDLGLDAMDILTNGEIVFSIEENVFSETLGPLQHGDLLSANGRIVARNQDLTAAFVIMPVVPDVGLDALQMRDDGEVYFSIETPIFSGRVGMLGRGDLLSNRGVIVKSNAQLLALFHPPKNNHDYGLDALYVWPSLPVPARQTGGEIWFSLEEGFQDGELGPILAGDLLSDQGYVVHKNLDLVSAFAPIEDLADFGLDALWLVSDASPPNPSTPAPHCTGITFDPATGSVSFQWDGAGRVFQLEGATNILGPWLPLSPILVEPPTLDAGALTNAPQGFYRLRQW